MKWENSDIKKISSTRAYFLKESYKITDFLMFFNGIEEITGKMTKLHEFGIGIGLFDEEFMMKIIIVNEKKVQFQIREGKEKGFVGRVLNFFVFLFCQ